MTPTEASAEATFDDVVLPHLDAARRLARWLVGNEHDAEDAVQEASLRAFRYFGDILRAKRARLVLENRPQRLLGLARQQGCRRRPISSMKNDTVTRVGCRTLKRCCSAPLTPR